MYWVNINESESNFSVSEKSHSGANRVSEIYASFVLVPSLKRMVKSLVTKATREVFIEEGFDATTDARATFRRHGCSRN